MSKVLFKLDPNPTFDALVAIPVPGGSKADVKFTFKHRSKTELEDFLSTNKDMDDTTLVKSIADGWELDDEFNDENIGRLLNNYIGAGSAIYVKYLEELYQAKRLN
ncbi:MULTISPECIES: phage tail assembly chaperone [Pseudomonas]|uniref:Phage tail assembly chaperone n=1 Tax=Pseudomonas lutea TaxID=243924 RepID=A0A9X8MHW8_9PSED|nr:MULTISPECIES: phage tail assembly chaperone [Pseudomonas]SER52324.1 Phage tail assembly chaperone [Pseudomonas lutea]SER52768.1 Phage tail assembly chaperone [Pseudomonas lutea]